MRELWLREPTPADLSFARSPSLLSWRNVFLALDRSIALLGRVPLEADAAARRGARHRMGAASRGRDRPVGGHPAGHGAVGAGAACHRLRGRPSRHRARGCKGLDDLLAQRGDQLALPAVRDADARHGDTPCARCSTPARPATHPALERAGEWLVERQIFRPGDWAVHAPGARSRRDGRRSRRTTSIPNVDVSALAVSVLAGPADRGARRRAPRARATASSGRSACRDATAAGRRSTADNDSRLLDAVPFPDLEGVTDPSCADITGRVLAVAASSAASVSASDACGGAPSSCVAPSTPTGAGRAAGASTRSTARGSPSRA